MATGDVTTTRAVATRDDYLDASLSTSNSGTVTTDTFTSDGDIVTWNITFTNPATNDVAILYRPVSAGPNSSTYTQIIVRANVTSWANTSSWKLRYWVHYSDTTSETGANLTMPANPGNWQTQTQTLSLSNKTVDQIGFEILTANGASGPWSFTVLLDFIFIFKETLTLPAASLPLSLPLSRRIAALQVPNRQGDILQDLGSTSPTLEVDGTLITTGSPNNYTGDQWWDVLVGTWLEGNWQWFTSDRVAYKYQISDLVPQQDPGRVGYYGYRMKLRKVDIIPATAQTFASNNGSGAIQ